MSDHALDILERVAALDEPCALVIVTDISGGTLRSKGALMAVTSEDVFGYISAGCVDGDIIFQAKEALAKGETRRLVYGEGSPFKDITLPCGGTIKIAIHPNPDKAAILQALEAVGQREVGTLRLPEFSHTYAPRISLRVVGRGAPFEAMVSLAHSAGFEVHGQSPDADLNRDDFARFDHLKDPSQIFPCHSDPWSAVVFLFHDHEWEPVLMEQALQGESFYIGAMGSERTHDLRLATLNDMGIKNLDRIRGPIGLIPAMRDANRLAISILAEIIDTAQKQGRLS